MPAPPPTAGRRRAGRAVARGQGGCSARARLLLASVGGSYTSHLSGLAFAHRSTLVVSSWSSRHWFLVERCLAFFTSFSLTLAARGASPGCPTQYSSTSATVRSFSSGRLSMNASAYAFWYACARPRPPRVRRAGELQWRGAPLRDRARAAIAPARW